MPDAGMFGRTPSQGTPRPAPTPEPATPAPVRDRPGAAPRRTAGRPADRGADGRLRPACRPRSADAIMSPGGGDSLQPPIQAALEAQPRRRRWTRPRPHRYAAPPPLPMPSERAPSPTGCTSSSAPASGRPTCALMAHEVAHVVQQRGAPAVQLSGPGRTDPYEREAHRASEAALRGERLTIHERVSRPSVQRLGISDALDYFADKANNIPGFRMFTIVLGVNPINMSRVERSAANILRAVIEFIPGGGLITQALDNYGVFDKVGGWVEEQIRTLGMTGSADPRGDRRVPRLAGLDATSSTWAASGTAPSASSPSRSTASSPSSAAWSAASSTFIKDAILRPLAQAGGGHARLRPAEGRAGPRPDHRRAGAAQRRDADRRLHEADRPGGGLEEPQARQRHRARLGLVPGRAERAAGLRPADPGAVHLGARSRWRSRTSCCCRAPSPRWPRVFGGFVGDVHLLGRQAGARTCCRSSSRSSRPAVMPYIRKAAGAFRTIVAEPDPASSATWCAPASRASASSPATSWRHLRKSLIDWLTGTLSGANIYIPQAFDLREIVKFVLSVLGPDLAEHPRQAGARHRRAGGGRAGDRLRHRRDAGHARGRRPPGRRSARASPTCATWSWSRS